MVLHCYRWLYIQGYRWLYSILAILAGWIAPSPPPPQEADLRYLVESIWGCQSILSAGKDLYDLTLVRWERGEQWAPWNCVLLTRDEAKGHCKLERVQEVREYGTGDSYCINRQGGTVSVCDVNSVLLL